MATKLVRLTNDLKKDGREGGTFAERAARRKDIETDELVEDLRAQVRDLEHKNEALNNKVVYYRSLSGGQQPRPPRQRPSTATASLQGSRGVPGTTRTARRSPSPDRSEEVRRLTQRLAEAESELAKTRTRRQVWNAEDEATSRDATFTVLQNRCEEMHAEVSRLRSSLEEEKRKREMAERRATVTELAAPVDHDMNQMIADLRTENEEIRTERDKLRRQALPGLGGDGESLHLKEQLKHSRGEHKAILEELREAQSKAAHAQKEQKAAEDALAAAKRQGEESESMLKYFKRERSDDMKEIEQVLGLIQRKKAQGGRILLLSDSEGNNVHELQTQTRGLKLTNADLAQELNKASAMLDKQKEIIQQYEAEKDTSLTVADGMKATYEGKLSEYARLLDSRAERIRELEEKIRMLAYDVHRNGPDEPLTPDDPIAGLADDENLFEFEVISAQLDRKLVSSDPILFSSISFYEHPLQITPAASSNKPRWNYVASYVVHPDDFFLYYLDTHGNVPVEIHQAQGLDFTTVGRAMVQLKGLLDGGRVEGSVKVRSATDPNVTLGALTYSCRLRRTIAQQVRIYRQRNAALGRLQSSVPRRGDLTGTAKKSTKGSANELVVDLVRLGGLVARRPGKKPRAFASYQLLDFPERITKTAHAGENAKLGDSAVYPVTMDSALESYLLTKTLAVSVFDDDDPDQGFFFGVAEIPLAPLVKGSAVKGEYVIVDRAGRRNGDVMVHVRMSSAYKAVDAKAADLAERALRHADVQELLRKGSERDPVAPPSVRPMSPSRPKSPPKPKSPPRPKSPEKEEPKKEQVHFEEEEEPANISSSLEDVIRIHFHRFEPSDDIIDNDEVKWMWSTCDFPPDLPAEEQPTTEVLEKPSDGSVMVWDLKEDVPVDAARALARRKKLLQLVDDDDRQGLTITFWVLGATSSTEGSPPVLVCEGKVDLLNILDKGDLVEAPVAVRDAGGLAAGVLVLSVQASDALLAIDEELE